MPSMTYKTANVGDLLPELRLPPVDRAMLALFAGASGDHVPLHIDTDFARRAGMPDVFAHGMLGMAWLGRLITDWAPQSSLRSFNVRFLAITHLGNAPVLTGKVIDVFEQDGERHAKLEVQMANQFGQTKILGDAVIALA
jgi:acyl dehydratase